MKMGGGGPFVAIFFLVLHSCLADKYEARLVADKLKNYNPLERPVFEPEDVVQLEFGVNLQVSEKLDFVFKSFSSNPFF